MSNNPLQQYFRQPKIYIAIPSKGAFCNPGVIQGDVANIPVYGMTGMDEIIIKTPDALLNGEAVVKIVESCVPSIKNAWGISNLDLDAILAGIRIATYGNDIQVTHKCTHCGHINDYELDLAKLIEHFAHVKYDNTVVLKDVVIKIKPLTYKQVTEFSLRNFQLQQQLKQANTMENEAEKKDMLAKLYNEFAILQSDVYAAGIESVHAGNTVVEERAYIDEWLANTETVVFDKIRDKIDENKDAWQTPSQSVVCQECDQENDLNIDLDYSTFFVTA